MTKLIKLSLICLLILNIFSALALTASAEEPATESVSASGLVPVPSGAQPSGCPAGTTNCGNYTLNEMLSIVVIVSNFILGIVGSLALIAFIAGGIMWLVSGGKAELVERGKQTIIGAVIGLAIVFTSYMIIQLVFTALGVEGAGSGQWSVANWFIK